jgi:hypothetical protein
MFLTKRLASFTFFGAICVGSLSAPYALGEIVFEENFDAMADVTADMYSTISRQERSTGFTIPDNWDAIYQGGLWSPATGFPNNHASFEILAADSAEARGGTGKAMRNYRESEKVRTVSDYEGYVVLPVDYTHIRIWQSTSPNFNTTKTSVATVNGTAYSFSTTTGSDGDAFPNNALRLDDSSLGAVAAQFSAMTGQRPLYGVYSNAMAVPAGATVSITNADIQGYGGGKWDERTSKFGSDSQLIKTPIDPNNPEGTDELYVEFWIKFSESWYQRGHYEGGWMSKIFRAASAVPGGNIVSGQQGDLAPMVLWDYKSDNFGVRNTLAFRGGPPSSLTTENNYKGTPLEDFGGSTGFTQIFITGQEVGGTNPQLPDLVNGGLLVNTTAVVFHESVYGPAETWTKVAFYLKMNSAPGVEDGIYSQYINGHRIRHINNAGWVGANTEGLMAKWNLISLGGNDNFHPYPGSDRFEDWYAIDNIVVRSSLPDVLQGKGVAPNPPVDIEIQ